MGCKQEREKEREDKGRERQSIGENQKHRGFRKVQLEKTPDNLWDRTNNTLIKMDINILGNFNFAGLLCRDFHSPYQGITPHPSKIECLSVSVTSTLV